MPLLKAEDPRPTAGGRTALVTDGVSWIFTACRPRIAGLGVIAAVCAGVGVLTTCCAIAQVGGVTIRVDDAGGGSNILGTGGGAEPDSETSGAGAGRI